MKIVQFVRDGRPLGGVSKVAVQLKNAFGDKGLGGEIVDLNDSAGVRPINPEKTLRDKIINSFLIVFYSFVGSFALFVRGNKGIVRIVHNDPLGGDIYIDHGCHKALVFTNPLMLLRNPLHLFLLAREEIRHRLGLYKYLVVLSEESKQTFLKYYPFVPHRKLVTIPNGIDLGIFRPSNRTRNLDDEFRLLFVGHEFDRKGLAYIIDALLLLPEYVKLVVVGGSNREIERYSQQVSDKDLIDRVSFVGKQANVASFFADAELFVLPSLREAWQLVALEAMASGVPLLSTPVGCAAEVISAGLTGHLIERSAADIADKVSYFVQKHNSDAYSEIRKECRKTAERYSWSSVAEKYALLANAVLGEGN